ncbi:MAG: VWA domain-containing protein [Pseudomonadota bacterium]
MTFELTSRRTWMMGTASLATMAVVIGAMNSGISPNSIGWPGGDALQPAQVGTLGMSSPETSYGGTTGATRQGALDDRSGRRAEILQEQQTGLDLSKPSAALRLERPDVMLESPPPPPVEERARNQNAQGATGIAGNVSPKAALVTGCTGATAACQPQVSGGVAVAVPTESSVSALVAPSDSPAPAVQEENRENFEDFEPNRVKVTAEEPVSTFSIDVDTASYAYMRSSLMNGILPPKDSIRVEELINYFPYSYEAPESAETPFNTDVSVLPTPWNDQTRIMRIGIKGYELTQSEKPQSNLVFLLDTSGSMNQPNKLPLLKNAFRMLVGSLDAEDTVSIVVYAGSAGTVLQPTKVSEKSKILSALDRLSAGGSTAGGEGIRQAYQLAEQNFDQDGINRVVLATDGDFNVGITDSDQLQDFIERKRETGVFLSILGFGRGNYNDALMQTLAQNGNGTAAYIDTLSEARKTLVEEAGSTLFPIANDVKIQVEFNPATVAEYRLIGYETRALNREDFNNDKVDAGEIGSGHSVTALYEITPAGSGARQVDALRYQQSDAAAGTDAEYAYVKVRYKKPGADTSTLISQSVPAEATGGDGEARFAAAVAAFGQILRGGRYTGGFDYADVIALANGAKGTDPFGYRAEFVNLVRMAESAAAMAPQRP